MKVTRSSISRSDCLSVRFGFSTGYLRNERWQKFPIS